MLLILALACAEPTIALLEPEDGAALCGEPLPIAVEVRDFELVRPVVGDEDEIPGTGHVDVALNGQEVAMIWEEIGEIPRVDAGIWLVRVELVGADHAPIQPPAFDEAVIEVDPSLCP